LQPARCNSDYGQPYDYLSYGEIIKNSDDFGGAGVVSCGSTEVGLYFFTPSHHAAQSRADLFDRMILGLPQQVWVACPTSFHLANKFTRKLARADFLQY
jgi:hypothetical protein